MIGLRSRSTSDLLPVQSIKDAALILRGGARRAVLECQTLAFGIKGEAEQRAVVAGWSSLLNSLTHPLQVVIRTRRLDPSALADPADEHQALRDSYRALVGSLADERRVVDRRFYVVVPWDRPRSRPPKTGMQFLEQRVSWLTDRLRRLDLEPRRLNDHSLAELLRRPMDPAAPVQPIADDDDLADISDLASPTALTEGMTSLTVSGRHACALTVSRYPARLHPGWLGDFNEFEGDLDLSLHIWPSSGPAVMSFLGRRIGELSSTLRIIDEKGGRPDPLRRAALKDAIELQDRIADGSERLFDVSLYLTVWADDTYDLDEATCHVETLLGTRMIHTRRLMLRMRQGLVSSMPVGVDQVRLHRVLSTSALAATFPFTGTDLPGRSGLLYGVNPATRSAVVLDRFALENYNAVVFATSAAGKSFLVKVELVRAVLSGTRALVVDPEGEYADVITALGVNAMPKDQPEMKTWSADELATFLAFAAQDRDLVLYHVAAATGMRRGELLGLRWRDVDLDAARLSVRQQYTRQGNGLGFGPPKSKKSIRTIDVDEETVELLREQQERQRFQRRGWKTAYRADLDLVFCRPGGSPEDPTIIGRRFTRRVRRLATVPVIGLHGLRHTHATLLLEAGVDVKTVSERLGHDNVQTTLDLYGHVTSRMRSNAAARFGSLLTTGRTPTTAIPAEN